MTDRSISPPVRVVRRTAWGEMLDDERGDVPGWVLITLMTAGLPVLRNRVQFSSHPAL